MSRTHDVTISAFDLDRLERELTEALSDLEFRRDLFKLQEQQLNDVRAERDRLAEACKLVMRVIGDPFASEEYCGATIDEIKAARNSGNAALAAVKGKDS
jgi:hypothetical protein